MQLLKSILFISLILICQIGFAQEIVKDTGISKKILKEGKGETAKKGQTVKVEISGWLENGEEFEPGGVLSFKIGDKNMIQGFNEVLPSMKKGEKAEVTIPATMGYGEKGVMEKGEYIVPPNATLIFEIKLLSIK